MFYSEIIGMKKILNKKILQKKIKIEFTIYIYKLTSATTAKRERKYSTIVIQIEFYIQIIFTDKKI